MTAIKAQVNSVRQPTCPELLIVKFIINFLSQKLVFIPRGTCSPDPAGLCQSHSAVGSYTHVRLFNKLSVKSRHSGKIAYSRESFKIFSWICCPHLDNWAGGMPELVCLGIFRQVIDFCFSKGIDCVLPYPGAPGLPGTFLGTPFTSSSCFYAFCTFACLGLIQGYCVRCHNIYRLSSGQFDIRIGRAKFRLIPS